ncbi:MAG: hypothetical protein ABMA15_15390 [Vicinamibacterales bacterium]
MRAGERIEDLVRVQPCLLERQRSGQGLPFNQFHHEELGANAETFADARVIQCGNRMCLAFEAFSEQRRSELDCDQPVEAPVARQTSPYSCAADLIRPAMLTTDQHDEHASRGAERSASAGAPEARRRPASGGETRGDRGVSLDYRQAAIATQQ